MDEGRVTIEQNRVPLAGSTHQLADKFFKKALQHKAVAQDFFRHHLPKELCAQLDFDSLQFENASFIDAEHYKKEVDVLYRASLAGRAAYLFLLAEHQSQPDPWMAYRLLVYVVRVMEFHHKRYPREKLPLVYPLVLYTGDRRWADSVDVRDLLDAPAELIDAYFMAPPRIIQGQATGEDELRAHPWSGSLEWLMSHVHLRDFMQRLEGLVMPYLSELSGREGSEHYLRDFIWYVLAKSEGDALRFKEMIERWFEPSTGEDIMTLAEQFEQQGFQRGIEQGVQQGIEQGVQQGIEQGVQQGIEQGVQQGIEQGVQQGVEQGIEQGVQQGITQTSLRLASRLLNSGLPIEQVAEMVELPLSKVISLAEADRSAV